MRSITPVVLLLSLLGIDARTTHAQVEFIVGDLMPAEGGNWNPSNSPLDNPFGVDFDSAGNLYVVELGGGRVHRLNPAGKLERISGDGSKSYAGDGGPAIEATFNGMHNCVVTPDDQLLISDSWNHCVRRIDLKSRLIDTLAGTGEAGFGGDGKLARQAAFNFLMCVALSHDGNILHIVDLKNRRVRNMDLRTAIVTTVAGNGEKGIPENDSLAAHNPLIDPRAAASDASGNLYILERGGNALRKVQPDGTIHTVAGNGKKGFRDGDALKAEFGSPKHICTDPAGNVFIADDLNGAIRKYDPNTVQVTTLLGRGIGHPDIRLSHPHGVRYHQGDLYVVDSGNSRLIRIAGVDH